MAASASPVDLEGKDDILDPRTGTRGYSENPAHCLADYLAHSGFAIRAGIDPADVDEEVQKLIAMIEPSLG